MPDLDLPSAYEMARAEHREAVDRLLPLLEQMAFAELRTVLPTAHELELHGELNEDWVPTLRIQRVLDAEGRVLFDIGFGHPDEAVEEMIDEVGVEYLDLILDLTGDDYMGAKSLNLGEIEIE